MEGRETGAETRETGAGGATGAGGETTAGCATTEGTAGAKAGLLIAAIALGGVGVTGREGMETGARAWRVTGDVGAGARDGANVPGWAMLGAFVGGARLARVTFPTGAADSGEAIVPGGEICAMPAGASEALETLPSGAAARLDGATENIPFGPPKEKLSGRA